MLTTPVYEATVLQLELEQLNLPQLVQQLSIENRISTEIEVLQGRIVAVAAIDSLGLRVRVLTPRRARTTQLFSVLRVAPTTDTMRLILRRGSTAASAFGNRSRSRARFWRGLVRRYRSVA